MSEETVVVGGQLSRALAAAQKEFTPVPKNKTATVKTNAGGSYTYKFADLADVLSMALPILSKHGIAFSQPFLLKEGKLRVVTKLSLGLETEQSDGLVLPENIRPQELGSFISYWRRYDACSMLGIAPDEDVDGVEGDKSATFQKQSDGSFSKNQPARTETVQKPEPKKPTTRKKAEATDYQPWGGVAGAKPKQTDFPHGHNLPAPEQAQTAQQTAPASPNAITPDNPITDADVEFPSDDKKDREPTEAERKVFLDKLIALKNKGYQGIREYILKETGVARTNDIGFNKMTELVARLEAADTAGTLKGLLNG